MSKRNKRRNDNNLEKEYKDANIVEKNDTIEEENKVSLEITDNVNIEDGVDNRTDEELQPITNPSVDITLNDYTLIKVEPVKDSKTYLYKELCPQEKELCHQKSTYSLACIRKGTVLKDVTPLGDGWYRIINGYVYNGEPEEQPYYMTKQGYTSRI